MKMMMMMSPLSASQTIAVAAIAAVLLGGAYALGRSYDSGPVAAPEAGPEQRAEQASPKPAKPPPVERSERQRQLASTTPAAKPAPADKRCAECSRVLSVSSETRQGEGSGVGAIGGAVIGGLLGNQVGGGSGRKIATVAGAAAGGYAGNELEKSHKSYRVWIVRLQEPDGSTRTLERRQDPQLRAGDQVMLHDGQLQRV